MAQNSPGSQFNIQAAAEWRGMGDHRNGRLARTGAVERHEGINLSS